MLHLNASAPMRYAAPDAPYCESMLAVQGAEIINVPTPQTEERKRGGFNYYWLLFILGFFLCIPWMVASFMPLCSRPHFPTKCHRYASPDYPTGMPLLRIAPLLQQLVTGLLLSF